jgi:hypothetical protein
MFATVFSLLQALFRTNRELPAVLFTSAHVGKQFFHFAAPALNCFVKTENLVV